jgi:site-specific recombinase XerD
MGRGHVSGVLAEHADGFRAELLADGYTEGSAARLVHLMAHLSRWMEAVGVGVVGLTPPVLDRFMAVRRAAGYVGWLTPQALVPLMTYLHGIGVVASDDAPREPSELEVLLGRYDAYLVTERDLAAASRRSYLGVACRFLTWLHEECKDISLGSLDAARVSAFVALECGRRAPGSASSTTTGMRSLLRFLYLHGLTPALLSAAVPSPAGWALASVPRYLSYEQVRALLASCDRSSAVGRRDFAVLTVLVRLGLRAGEVARLEFGDVDWRRGELGVRVKGGRVERLPLPVDVGEAIVAWLRDGRPRAGGTTVFCRLRAPHGALTAGAVSAVVRHAAKRAGMAPIGAHRLRHTAATTMLRAGASLVEVGRVLRHRRPHTTAVYAKVDFAALSELAQPWPGARS